ncbi:MAG: hypothetical protein QG658_635 [Patescibacteria group bacterium]|jgi:hypothetical protein|nr:hypothetical protein [Patescibacteria group bacterium]
MSPRSTTPDSRPSYEQEAKRERATFRFILVASIVSVILLVILLPIMLSSTSCSGEQTVEVRTGDNLTVLILGNVDGALDDSVSMEDIISLVTEEQPELNGTITDGKTVTLPESCSNNGFGSNWDRGQQ